MTHHDRAGKPSLHLACVLLLFLSIVSLNTNLRNHIYQRTRKSVSPSRFKHSKEPEPPRHPISKSEHGETSPIKNDSALAAAAISPSNLRRCHRKPGRQPQMPQTSLLFSSDLLATGHPCNRRWYRTSLPSGLQRTST